MNADERNVEGRRAAPLPLATVPLALVQPTALEDRDQLLRRAEIIAVVPLASARGGDPGGVVEIVAPEHVEAEAAARRVAEQPGVLGLALADDKHPTIPGRLAHPPGDRPEDVLRAGIEEGLRAVDSHAVDVELVDPVRRRWPGRTRGPARIPGRRSSALRPTRSYAASRRTRRRYCLKRSPPGPRWL